MDITTDNLNRLRVGFNKSYQGALGSAGNDAQRIATRVPATQKSQTYGWLGKLPNVREWIGARVVQNISESDYTIKERPWELTIGVDRDDIETDNLGQYAPLFSEMGVSTGAFSQQLLFGMLLLGFTTNCFDGQFFFDTDHPIIGADGNMTTFANTDGGNGMPWFLIDISRAILPIIWQVRRDFGDIVARDKVTDDNVFDLNEFRYGVDARMNAGFSFPQLAWGSKQALDAAHYETAKVAIGSMKGDNGRPLGLGKKLLLAVPPSLEGAGRAILTSQLVNGGESNKWAGSAELLVTPWLA
jgi:phage major head subunit gpT-like protein